MFLSPFFGGEFVVSQLFAVLAIVSGTVSFFCNKKSTVLTMQMISALCETASYLFLGADFGVVGLLCACVRTAIFTFYERLNLPVPKFLIIVIIIITIILAIVFYRSYADLFLLTGLTIYTLALSLKTVTKLKIGVFFANALYFIYDILLFNPSAAVAKGINMCLIAVALFSAAKKNKNKRKEVEL